MSQNDDVLKVFLFIALLVAAGWLIVGTIYLLRRP